MSYIENPESYKSHPNVFLINKDFKVTDLGVYDPLWDVVSENYISGRFMDEKGKLYDDKKYNGKNCTILRFDHYMFGNTPLGRKIGTPHEHTKIIVSTNDISLDDVRVMSSGRDIFYYADLTKPSFVVNGGEYVLYEVEPHLNPNELEDVKVNVNAVAQMKNKLSNSTVKQREAEAELLLAMASIAGANAHISVLNSYVEQYKAQLDEITEQAIKVGFVQSELALKTGREIEKNFDIQLDWRKNVSSKLMGDVNSKAKMVSKFFSSLDEYKNDQTLTDTMKEYMVDVVVDICGIDYVRRKVDDIERNGALTNKPESLVGNNLNLMRANEQGIISEERVNEIIKNTLNNVQIDYGKTGNIKTAVANAFSSNPFASKLIEQQRNEQLG